MSPDSLPIVRLGDLAFMTSGGTPSSSVSQYYGGGIPWVSISDMTSGGKYITQTQQTLSEAGLRASAAKLYEPNVVLYAMYASLGECSIAEGRVTSSQAILAIKPGAKLDTEFLYYFLQSMKSRVKTMGQQGTQSNLNAHMVRDFKIPLPSPAMQRKIANILGDVDLTISSAERLIAKKQAIKQGMMQELLTGKTRLPGFNSEWQKVLLGEHVTYLKTIALSRAELDSHSPLCYLHYGDIHTGNSVRLDAANDIMPRVAAAKARDAGRLQVGDLVFADASEDPDGVGKSVELISIPPGGVVPGLHTIAARFDKTVLADGFKAYLQFFPGFRDALLRLASGTKVLATTRKYISSVALNLPGIAEQKAIAQVLQDGDTEIEALHRQSERVRNIKQGMMQELLTGRTRLTPVGV